MLYFIQVTVYSALMYVLYLLILKNRTDHKWSRLYLLGCAILPIFIPFLKIRAIRQLPPDSAVATITLPVINIYDKGVAATQGPHNWGNIILYGYLFVCLVFLSKFLFELIRFRRFTMRHKAQIIGRVKVLTDTGIGPGSYGSYIFLPGNDTEPAILGHETGHVLLHHSRDIVLLRSVQCFLWPNLVLPFIYKELKTVHEFQADAYSNTDKQAYATALLNNIFATKQFSLSHTFFHHPIKRRIMILQKTAGKAPHANRVMTIITAGSLLAGVVYMQSCKQDAKNGPTGAGQTQITKQVKTSGDSLNVSNSKSGKQETKNGPTGAGQPQVTKQTKILADSLDVPNSSGIYGYVSIMPQPDFDLAEFLQQNIKYPDAARKQNIAGRVMVRFIIDADGNVTDPAVLGSPDSSLSAEAITVIREMPKWKPGSLKNGEKVPVRFMLPISFQLQ